MVSVWGNVTEQRSHLLWWAMVCFGVVMLSGCASTSNWLAIASETVVGPEALGVLRAPEGFTVDPRALDEPDSVERLIDSAEQYNQSVTRALEQLRRKDQAAAEDAAILAAEMHRRRHQRASIVSHLKGKNAERYQATIRVLDELGAKALALSESLQEKNLASLADKR